MKNQLANWTSIAIYVIKAPKSGNIILITQNLDSGDILVKLSTKEGSFKKVSTLTNEIMKKLPKHDQVNSPDPSIKIYLPNNHITTAKVGQFKQRGVILQPMNKLTSSSNFLITDTREHFVEGLENKAITPRVVTILAKKFTSPWGSSQSKIQLKVKGDVEVKTPLKDKGDVELRTLLKDKGEVEAETPTKEDIISTKDDQLIRDRDKEDTPSPGIENKKPSESSAPEDKVSTPPKSKDNKWEVFTSNEMGGDQLLTLLEKFKEEILIPKLSGTNDKMLAQLRGYQDGIGYRSITTVDVIDIDIFDDVISSWYVCYDRALEQYILAEFESLEIYYKVVPGDKFKTKLQSKRMHDEEAANSKLTTKIHDFTGAPKSMDFKGWGEVRQENDNTFKVKMGGGREAEILVMKGKNIVTIFEVRLGIKSKLESFVDTKRIPATNKRLRGLTEFARVYKEKILIINGGKIRTVFNRVKSSFIDPIHSQSAPNNKIITMDIETRREARELVPVMVSLTDGVATQTFWVNDYESPTHMMESAVRSIMKRKYYNYKVYLHNFARFDAVFLLKVLLHMEDSKLDIIRKDGTIKRISMKFDPAPEKRVIKNDEKVITNVTSSGSTHKGTLTFYDSYQIMPQSLDKLTKAFNCSNKGMFPLKFLESAPLNYIGNLPGVDGHYHPDPINQKEGYDKFLFKYREYYKDVENNNWNLRDELTKYCEQDVVSLHQVIVTYSTELYKDFGINALLYSTAPSIAMAIYRRSHLGTHKIPKIKGALDADIRRAYLGGYVDLFKPTSNLTHSYDVNSLYPAMMASKDMPVGTPWYFKGGDLDLKDVFGFIEVEVTSPMSGLKTPILPTRYKENGITTTIFPYGTWTGWYFSEEVKNATKYGYSFKIIRGVQFHRARIFKSYVDLLYKIKSSNEVGGVKNTSAKLSLNSLYGRTGMSPVLDKTLIMTNEKYMELKGDSSNRIIDELEIGSKVIVTIQGDRKSEREADVSVSIAAAVTAYSRIHMSKFITKYPEDICYIDTDGIKLTKTLPSWEVGKGLGLMKHEGSFSECVYLAPKVYGCVELDTNKTLVKVKGLKSSVNYWDLLELLKSDSIVKYQDKWMRRWGEGSIEVVPTSYTLRATSNKRRIIRNTFGRIVEYIPFVLFNGVKVYTHVPPYNYIPTLPNMQYSYPTDLPHNTGTLQICRGVVNISNSSKALVPYSGKHTNCLLPMIPDMGTICSPPSIDILNTGSIKFM